MLTHGACHGGGVTDLTPLDAQQSTLKFTLPCSFAREWRTAALAGPNVGAEKRADWEPPKHGSCNRSFPPGKKPYTFSHPGEWQRLAHLTFLA
jgi:hypothetical protein